MVTTTARPSQTEVTRWLTWWVATWLVGTFAGTIVLSIAFAPTRPDGALGPGDVLAPPIGVVAASLLAMWTAYLVGMRLASERLGSGDPSIDFRLSVAPVDLLGIPIGIASQLGLVWLVYLPLRALWPDTFAEERLDDTARDLVDRADGGLLVLLVVLVAIGAPVVEELFYRGFLQRPALDAARTDARRWAVVVGVAVVFAAIHLRPVEFPGLLAFGLVLGIGAWKTGRIGLAVLAHVAFNATGLVSVL